MKYVYYNDEKILCITKTLHKNTTASYKIVEDDFDMSSEMEDENGEVVKLENSISVQDFLAKFDSNYIASRVNEYPSIEEQLDMLYHGGYDSWRNAIQEIKNKYPKS